MVKEQLRRFVASKGKESCDNIGLEKDKLNLFYPQGVQKNWLESPKLIGWNKSLGDKKNVETQ